MIIDFLREKQCFRRSGTGERKTTAGKFSALQRGCRFTEERPPHSQLRRRREPTISS